MNDDASARSDKGPTGTSPRRTSPNSARVEKDFPVPAHRLSEAVLKVVSGLSRWSLQGDNQDKGRDASEGQIHAVRATRVFRFKDDVRVSISSTPDGSRLVADSASRVGKGDLGQNPRNLDELVSAIEEELRSR